jgi:hypothetical protein
MRTLTLLLLVFRFAAASAQEDDRSAYVTQRYVERTADDAAIGPLKSMEAHSAERNVSRFSLPPRTAWVDILDAKGRVKHRWSAQETTEVRLASLRPGTWTIRAETPSGYAVRRFLVMRGGRVIWSEANRATKR